MAIDVKLPPLEAQFRVLLRMVSARLEAAFHRFIAWRVFPWMVRFTFAAVELMVVACVVELAMTLPMAIYFHRITLFALPVNLLILPLLLVLMPAAVVTLIALLAWPPAAVAPAAALRCCCISAWGWCICSAHWRWAIFAFRRRWWGKARHFACCLALAILLARGGRWHRRVAWAALVLAAVAAVLPRAANILATRCWWRPSTWARAIRCC